MFNLQLCIDRLVILKHSISVHSKNGLSSFGSFEALIYSKDKMMSIMLILVYLPIPFSKRCLIRNKISITLDNIFTRWPDIIRSKKYVQKILFFMNIRSTSEKNKNKKKRSSDVKQGRTYGAHSENRTRYSAVIGLARQACYA